MGLAGRGQGNSSLSTVLKKWFGLYTDMGGSFSEGRDAGQRENAARPEHTTSMT